MRKSVVAGLVALMLLAGFAYWVSHHWEPRLPLWLGADCRVGATGAAIDGETAVDGQVELDREQLANAATITATGARLGMPDRAVVVALATALQESKLRNLPHLGARNDHDSIGLFQQRPSQGWGSEAEISDPRYAAERFYSALAEVSGWQEMRLTDAAQRVQRSAFPEAYQQWEGDATVLAAALLGRTGPAIACQGSEHAESYADAETVRHGLSQDWGEQVPVDTQGKATVAVPIADESTSWRYAHWLVAHAHTFGVRAVHVGELVWQAGTGDWEPATRTDHVRAELHA